MQWSSLTAKHTKFSWYKGEVIKSLHSEPPAMDSGVKRTNYLECSVFDTFNYWFIVLIASNVRCCNAYGIQQLDLIFHQRK